ncbi:hypothetical protein Ciccas_004459 [Cichlidogyrus casuarinus]|uniref:Mitochondrial glutamate carrier 1 n=1 Tax=Cichlidogyrus casuarinus TaxID=1844966 RepID=A0ABD2QEZ4_9PLAT
MVKLRIDALQKIAKSEGIVGLYRGSAVNLLLITPEKAIKLVGNDFFRYHLKPMDKPLTPIREMLAGASAGTCQIIVTTPMELLKIQLQDAGRTGKMDVGAPKQTATSIASKLLAEKGVFGLYRGLSATFARDVTFSALYFPLFAHLNKLGPRREGSTEAVFYWSFMAGLSAGAFSSWIVTPLDVVKTRLQTINRATGDKVYSGMFECFVGTFREEGPRALFKGAGSRVAVIAPLFAIAQTVYYLGVGERILGIPRP